jgi:hypothetical protein
MKNERYKAYKDTQFFTLHSSLFKREETHERWKDHPSDGRRRRRRI